MTDVNSGVLDRSVQYSGEQISVKSLESTINTVRKGQDVRVADLKQLRERNVQIQHSLAEEVKKLRRFSDYLSRGDLKGGLLANLKEILSYLPGLKGLALTRRSIEELLRQQYEISARRVKEAAEFADRLKASEQDLYDEIERLNERIVESARNEDVAAEYVLDLQKMRDELEEQIGKS